MTIQSGSEQGTRPPIHPDKTTFIMMAGFLALVVLIFLAATSSPDCTVFVGDQSRERYYWDVGFQLDLQPGIWSEGQHDYTISVDCPGSEHDFTTTNTFQVSANSPSHSYRVFLRTDGLCAETRSADDLTTLHPDQPTSVWVGLELPSQELAEQCQASVSWDGQAPQPVLLRNLWKIDTLPIAW